MKHLLTIIILLMTLALLLNAAAGCNTQRTQTTITRAQAQATLIDARARADRLAALTRADVEEKLLAARTQTITTLGLAALPILAIAVVSVFGAISIIALTRRTEPHRITQREIIYLVDSPRFTRRKEIADDHHRPLPPL